MVAARKQQTPGPKTSAPKNPGRKTLGRGLSSLFGEDSADDGAPGKARDPQTVAITNLRPGHYQPRHTFDDTSIDELARSISAKGILQPLLVRPNPDSDSDIEYEIIAGERRWRAAQKARLHEVPVVIREMSDDEALEIALIENLQRENLSPLEEAQGFLRLMEEFSHTQENLANALGKSRSHVANMLRLLGLPDQVKEMLNDGRISAGHARAILAAADPVGVAATVVSQGLNVRQTERLVKKKTGEGSKSKPPRHEKDSNILALERDLSNLLGLKVEIDFSGTGGALKIHYKNLDQLDVLLGRLRSEAGN